MPTILHRFEQITEKSIATSRANEASKEAALTEAKESLNTITQENGFLKNKVGIRFAPWNFLRSAFGIFLSVVVG